MFSENLSQKAQSEKVKQRLVEHKEKRHIESKLLKVKGLGESEDEDDSTQAWVLRNRKMQEEKAQAEKRVRILLYWHGIKYVYVCESDCLIG